MEKLTNSQKSIWVTEQYYKGSSVNNICGSAIINEKIDFEKLKKAVQIVYQKHDNFRLQLKIDEGEVKQILSEKKETEIEIICVATPKELEQETRKIVTTPFKLENSELFKFYIFKFENGEGGFMLNIHHLIADAWTLAFISNEIIKTYSQLKQNKEVETKAIYSYIDYIQAEKEYLESEKYQKDKIYWEEKFAQIPEVATIPGSKTNGDENNPKGERKQFNLNSSEVEKIKQYCQQNKISLYNFFMAVYGIYIGEISNLDEFVIGTPILNRTNFKEKNAAGMFINMAPFKINMDQASEFKGFVKNIAIDSMGMLKHQKYSYQSLLENLREKNKTIPSLYNILLSYQITNAHQTGEDMTYTTQWTFNGCCAENMDIQIYDLNDTGSLNIAYDYKTSIYTEEDIEKLHKRILNIVGQVISKDNIELKDIEIVTPEEKQQLVIEFNKTKLEYDKNIPIIKYFEKQASKTPENTAVIFENKKMTYKELNEKANSLAYELRKNGVTNNTIVGILQDRSFEMMIAILAVLKAGGSYIPIAPDYPDERIEYMLKDSNATILLTTNKERIKTDKKIIDINLSQEFYKNNKQNLENISKPEDLSYLIYTSGSTGTPKGVMLKQKNLTNFYNAMKDTIKYLKDGKQHKIISITTVSFDIFIFETLMSLTKGLTLYMTNENEQKITSQLEKLIKENKIEILQTTPSVMKFHLDNLENKEDIKSLKYIMLAGEPLPKTLVDKLKETIPGVTIYNGYGPSETTIFSTTRDVTDLDIVTIGRPVANTQIYILNKNKKLMPQGTIGEIYIAGDGVGKGYMNKKEQTESSFIQNPFAPNSIMYKVGDLGAFDKYGEITCYGRVDNQIKIRGLRVELPEIEKQMLSTNNVQNTVVVKKEINGREVLCAYYVPNGPVDENVMKSILKDKLPQYMIPQYFVKLTEMPYTPNGKIDKRALPIPNIKEKAKEKIEIRNEIDKELLQIIQKMMNTENISLSDTLIDIGGDSLTAITLLTKIASKFDVQLYIKDIMSNKTIKDISDLIKESQEKGFSKIKIEKAPEQKLYPLSSAQKRMYYNSKMIGEDNTVYNISGGILVDDVLDKEKVQKAFEKIIERHSVLRTVFVLQENNVVQKVNEKIDFKIPVYYNTQSEIQNIKDNFSKPFNLEKDLLLRVELHYIDNNKTLLLLESHHVAMDGTSLNNLIIEFKRLYNDKNLKTIPVQYTDYAVWENKFNKSDTIKKAENYWVNKFKEEEFAQLNLPYDYKITANRSYKGNRISNIIDEEQFRKIEKYAEKIGVSPYMLFISAFFILLYKYTGQEEIMVGSPIANRDINETKRMIGMFVNNIVVKGNINAEETFQEFLNKMKEQILDDLSNQPYPFDMLVKKLGIKADNSRNPLFDVMFTYQNQEENMLTLNNHKAEVMEINNNISKFNLSLEIKPKTHTFNLEYCTDLFKKQTIERFFEHYMNVIDCIVDSSNVKIKDISIISEQEKNKILYEFNDTKTEYPMNKTVAQLFEEQVEKTPDNVAVVFEDKKLTYRELNEKANQLANYLKNIKINPRDAIGIMLPRSKEIAIAFLGVLKAGATYIPIDPAYPEKRVEYMLENSKAKLLITTNDLYEKLNVTNKISIESQDIEKQNRNNLSKMNLPGDLSYIIYTSGSTGLPKGVKITNKNLVNFIFGTKELIDFNENKTIVSVTTICFDIFGLELWCALTSGMTLVIANEEEQHNAAELNKLCIKNNVNMIQTTPSRYILMMEDEDNIDFLKNMTDILVGGEPIDESLLTKMQNNFNAKIFNMYGPTETTIWSTVKELTSEKNITIGKPIANTQVYVLDDNLKVVPIGVTGELYIAGDGVGKGYLNRDDITKERYIQNPFIPGSIMYKTGDICKLDETGELYCLGRIDNQVKIRGLRIELDEIEKRIIEFPNIKKAKVVKQTVENKEVISAYYILNKKIRITELRAHLYKFLPNYMVPSYFTELNEFPYTPNGKIDKNALIPANNDIERKSKIVKPKTKIQQIICNAFEKVLKLKEVSIDDNFFEYGGDSISAMMLQAEIARENLNITYSDIFKYPTVRMLADQIKNSTEALKIEKTEEAEYYPVSSAQKRVYLTSNMDKNSTLYNITGGVLIDEALNIEKLQDAVNKVVNRHEVLRAYFEVLENGEIVQKIDSKVNVDIKEEKTNTNDIEEIFKKYQQPFELNKAPLLRTYLIKLPNNKYLFMLDVHHIIFDGGSLKIFLNEVLDLYNEKTLNKLPINYKDFAVWENEQLRNNKFEKSREFWKNQFIGENPILNMPTQNSRPAKRNYKGESYTKTISKELTEKIEALAKNKNVTPYMIMLSAYYILLYKYTGQDDIIVGTPVSGRIYNELEPLLGMFVNSLPLRQQISSQNEFVNLLDNVKKHCIECFSHQEYPFDVLVNELNLPRDSNRNPLFDTMFIYQNNSVENVKVDTMPVQYCIPKSKNSKFDVSLEVVPIDGEMKLSFEYWTELFDDKFINKFAEHYLNILQVIIEQPNIKIKHIPVLSEDEKQKILYEFNDTKLDYEKDKDVAQLFEEQVQKNPNKIAVIFEDEKLTYKELNEKANQLANYIRKLDIKPNDLVGIMLPRSLELISTVLGVRKSGASYIPIDPTYPQKRIEYMLENSQAKILLTIDKLYNNIKFKNKICVDYRNSEIYTEDKDNLEHINNMDDLVYVIYTSGSTGNPKGVKITNKNLTNFVIGTKNIIDFNENKTMVSVTTISFDIFGLEIWESLTSGLTLVVANENEQNLASLLNKLCIKHNANMIQTTPSRYALLLEEKDNLQFLRNMTDILVGGEPLEEQILKQLREKSDAKIFNMYGPTETTIWSTVKEIECDNQITIGKPISNTQVYVLDENLQPVPIGVTGELYIAGDGVGKGYLNREDITKERYINNPFIPESVMYKTGDICKFDETGELYCLGRIDNQVKIRGLRIELDEIEKRILQFPKIKQAKVVKQVIGNREIISAYYIATDRIRITELRSYLYKYLPNYMIPSYFTALDQFKYTPNGKIDKNALPIPNGILKKEENTYIAPKNDLQSELVTIWEEILNTRPIGISDNFFELGGDSILAMNLNIKLLKITDTINYSDIFSYPTIAELSDKIENEIRNDEKIEDLTYLNNQYKDILDKNMEKPKEINYHEVGNVLLTGATGFLGIHILEELLKQENGKIYVLIRKEPGMTVREKLLNKMHYYFEDKYDKYIDDRIIIVEGQIAEDGFGLNQEELFNLGNSIDIIINSAAKVSHYGKYADFYNVNVKSVEKIVNFANTFNLKIFHISTLSVSGNTFADQYYEESNFEKEIQYYENNFYIGQSLKNVYVRSKFEAERRILEAISKGTDAYILRMGNLMPRLSDGKFQDNISENAYINRLKEIFKIGYIPDYLKDGYLELTPIDSSADAVLKIIQYTNKNNRIYHLFNDYHVYISEVLKIANKLNESLVVIENDKFKEKIKEILNSEQSSELSGLINDLDKDLNLHYDSKIKIDSEHSKKLLKMYGFNWTKIEEKYLENILKLIKGEINNDSK